VCGLAAGCSGGKPAAASNGGGHTQSTGQHTGSTKPAKATSKPPVPAAHLTISPATSSHQVATNAPIRVAATGGTIKSVSVHTAGDPVSGALSSDKTSWSSTSALNVNQLYTVTAVGANSAGKTVTTTSSFRTLTPTQTFTAQISESEGDTYGVGMPIQLTFDQPVTNKADVERALHLRTSKPVVGAWYWLDDKDLDFRPRDYWPANTSVSFTGLFNGVQIAPGVYGAADLTQKFTIGNSVIVEASTTTHHMQLYVNGRKTEDWPISTGTPGDDTPNGTFLTINKGNPVEMKPSDIAPGQPGYYDLEVPWSTRFTWSGDFLHDAYWSVSQQGYENVSHGCVNMPPAAAEQYYNMAVPGDPVTITGSPAAGQPGDGWTDWFYTFDQVVERGALHEAVSTGPGGSSFVSVSSLPADTAPAITGRPSPNNNSAA
jgi:lipoprotein-anchoring transpeptidase ErfK/SrfK